MSRWFDLRRLHSVFVDIFVKEDDVCESVGGICRWSSGWENEDAYVGEGGDYDSRG